MYKCSFQVLFNTENYANRYFEDLSLDIKILNILNCQC